MKHLINLSFLFFSALFSEYIDVLTYFSLTDFPITLEPIEDGYSFREFYSNFDEYLEKTFLPETKKILIMGNVLSKSQISKLPTEKLALFLWESNWEPKEKSYYDLFTRIYTYDDDLVDNKKYFKLYYPCLIPLLEKRLDFNEKKLCTMVASNWTQERCYLLNFFDTKSSEDFEYYGSKPGPKTKHYRGSISGSWRSSEKLSILSKYRFCICFENRQDQKGYITEKIFCCFASGCIPIYWGAPNITNYIPKTCFIDYRDFTDLNNLYEYLKNMNEETYKNYLHHIEDYLQSEKADLFSSKHFNKILLDAIKN
jgi:hypothetical protein